MNKLQSTSGLVGQDDKGSLKDLQRRLSLSPRCSFQQSWSVCKFTNIVANGMKCCWENILPGGPNKNNNSPFFSLHFLMFTCWLVLFVVYVVFCCSQYKYWRFMFSIVLVHVEHILLTTLYLMLPSVWSFCFCSLVLLWDDAEQRWAKIQLQCCSFWDIPNSFVTDLKFQLLGEFNFE